MGEPIFVAGNYAELERAISEICSQIDRLAQHVPEEEDRAFAEQGKEFLWRMYRSAYRRMLAREGLEQ